MSTPNRLPVPEDLRAEVEQAQRLGVAIYLQDIASAIATDVARARLGPSDGRSVAGYLAIREAPGDAPTDTRLVWFFTAADPPEIVCRVRVPMRPRGEPTFEVSAPRVPVPPDAQPLIRARRTALAALGAPAQPQNPVVLPGSAIGHDGILVHLLAGSPRSDVAVLGKHHRVLISPDGATVIKLEPLSRSAIEIPLHSPDMPPGSVSAGLSITHLVSACPVETHVFASLLHQTPVFVGTGRGVWCVEGDQISFLGQQPPA